MTISAPKSKSKNPEIEQIATELDHIAAELAAAKDVFGTIIQGRYGDSIADAGSAILQDQVDRVDELSERLRALAPLSKHTAFTALAQVLEELTKARAIIDRAEGTKEREPERAAAK